MKTGGGTLWGAVLLIVGTSIGAAMLALPVELSVVGFISGVTIAVVIWFVMMQAAFLMLEVNLRLEPGNNIISMAQATLGVGGKFLAWAGYLLLLYCLIAAYISGISSFVSHATAALFEMPLYAGGAVLIAVVFFALTVFYGAGTVDIINRILMVCLACTFIVLMVTLMPYVKFEYLSVGSHYSHWLQTLPIVITAFGYHILIPSLRTYLHSDVKLLRRAIMIGGSIPLVIYLIWMFIVMGVVPRLGDHGLLYIWQHQELPTGLVYTLQDRVPGATLHYLTQFFSFFAIATSLLGVSLSLFDFLADGLQINKKRLGRLSTVLLTFTPPLVFAIWYPKGFIVALRYSALFVAFLLGILPAIMAMAARVRWCDTVGYRVWGGWVLPIVVMGFSMLIILIVALPAVCEGYL